jgi:CheY-like chemotaxis protein
MLLAQKENALIPVFGASMQREQSPAQALRPSFPLRQYSSLNRVILAVDLVPCEHHQIAAKLRKTGYDVLFSRNIKEAVDLVSVNRRLDAILINDLGKPSCVLVTTLQAINARIPILVVSSDADGYQPEANPLSVAIEKLEQLWSSADSCRSPTSEDP